MAQHRTTSLHGTIALGTGSMGFSGLVSGTVQRGHGALSLRTTGNLPSDPSPVASDLGLVVHYAARSRDAFLSIGAGLAAVFTGDSARIYTAPVNAHTTVGLPLEAQAFWRPISGLGLGAIAYGDLNPRRSFVGVLLGIQVGGFQR